METDASGTMGTYAESLLVDSFRSTSFRLRFANRSGTSSAKITNGIPIKMDMFSDTHLLSSMHHSILIIDGFAAEDSTAPAPTARPLAS